MSGGAGAPAWGSRLGLHFGSPCSQRIPQLGQRCRWPPSTVHCAHERLKRGHLPAGGCSSGTTPQALLCSPGSVGVRSVSPGQSNSRGNPGDDGFPDGLLFPEGGNGPGPNLPLPCPQGLCPRVSVQLPSISCPWVLTGPWRRAGSGLCEGTRVCSPSASIPIRRNVCVPT